MTTTYEKLSYCAQKRGVLRCAPRDETGSRVIHLRDHRRSRPDVHLLPCNRPTGRLEPAPRTALSQDSAHVRWEGFWCVADEGYYTRSVREDGREQWYRVADETTLVTRRSRRARVLPLRRVIVTLDGRRVLTNTVGRVCLLGSSTSKRTILVGTSRRRSRLAGRGLDGALR